MATRAAFGAVVVGTFGAAMMAGCNHYVSSRDYLDTSMARSTGNEPADLYVYGYVPPAETYGVRTPPVYVQREESPPVIVIRTPGPDYVRAPSPNAAWYQSNVTRELDALQHQMDRIESRARLKGAAALAAIEPPMRDFNMARDDIREQMNDATKLRSEDWGRFVIHIDHDLTDVRQTVGRAEEALNATPQMPQS
jgi:hypothetical protein